MNISELGITINHIFRYGYGGFLLFLAGAVVSPEFANRVVASLGGGGIFLALAAFLVGGIVYVVYRPIVNNLIIDGAHRGLHRRLEGRWGLRTLEGGVVGYNCKLHYLEDRFRVPSQASLDAFRSVRDRLFDPERRDRFELNHSENHLLGMTFLVLLVFAIVAWILGKTVVSAVFGVISLCSLGLEIYSDLFICRRECRYLMTLETEKIGEVLQRAEFS